MGSVLKEGMDAVTIHAPPTRGAVGLYCEKESDSMEARSLGLPHFLVERFGDVQVGCVIMFTGLSYLHAQAMPLTSRIFGGIDWLTLAAGESDPREVFPAEWNLIQESVGSPLEDGTQPRVLVCGRRGVGKSTFMRFLVNRFLGAGATSVNLVDTDPGQPEIGPPGTVSVASVSVPLLSAGFCLPPTERANDTVLLVLPGTSLDLAPTLYMQCVARLAALARNHPSGAPIVVNTPGWIAGTGLELLKGVIELFDPTYILQLVDAGEPPLSLPRLLPIVSQAREATALPQKSSASQLRDVSLSCHLGLEHGQSAILSFTVSRLAIVLHDMSADLPSDLVFAALDHTVVALVSSVVYAPRQGTWCSELPPDGICLGFGIVRRISRDGATIDIECNSSVASKVGELFNVLVRAQHTLPVELLTLHGNTAYTRERGNIGGGVGANAMTGTKWVVRAGKRNHNE